MIDKEAAFTVIICSAISFFFGMYAMGTKPTSLGDCKRMQQRLEKRISDDKRSLELLKGTEIINE